MDLMKGKKGIIFGVSNTSGIAYGIANELFKAGADIAFTYANEAMEKRVRPIAESMNAKMIMECDVTNEEKLKEVFETYNKTYDSLDFVIHAVAFANREDLTGEFVNTSKAGWDLALGVSAYSLVAIARNARPYMKNGGSIFSLTYLGSEKVVANYNIMGVAKATLEASTRYLADNLGKDNIRVNCISAGPVKTLAAKGIGGFDKMLKAAVLKAPLKRNVSLEDIGKTGLYLASDLSTGVTGEVIHVDCGCHAVYGSLDEMEAFVKAHKYDEEHAE
ncbi:MAG: enoyl-ACP reductase [Candidatus Gastranaerophilales bacterium]|nr:enoyl-ACP reductase [Candidatus Gastranaerophilales bacterium]